MGVEGACGDEYAVGLCDAHCHVDFAADARSVARDADRAGCALLCSTVEPQGFDRARALFLPASFSLVRVGVGMHPRWVAPEPGAARAQAREVVRRLSHAAFAGKSASISGRAMPPRLTCRNSCSSRLCARVRKSAA